MQDIATKLSRVATAIKAAGLTHDQARHLIHGTGGSPRRAKRAIRLGIHDQLIAAYSAALLDGGSHATATAACNKLWAELVPSAPAADPDDTDTPDGDDAGDDADDAVAAAAAKPAPKRIRRMGVVPSVMPSAADLKALLPA